MAQVVSIAWAVTGLAAVSSVVRVPFRRFLLVNATRGLLWTVGFTLLGYAAGASYQAAEKMAGRTSGIILAVVVLIVVVFVLRRRHRERHT